MVLADFDDRQIAIDVPEDAEVIDFEERQATADPVAATVKAIANPHGCPQLSELAGPGIRVAVATVQASIPVLVQALLGHCHVWTPVAFSRLASLVRQSSIVGLRPVSKPGHRKIRVCLPYPWRHLLAE